MDQEQNEQDADTKLLYYQVLSQSYAHLALWKLPPYPYILRELSRNPYLLEPEADIRTYRAYVEAKGNRLDDVTEKDKLLKSSIRAEALRRRGNELFRRKLYDGALMLYNESICAAPNDSEDLAIGYANRSAVFYAKATYGVALVNIALAKKHNYPERLMPKLLTREANCRQKLEDKDPSKNEVPSVTVNLVPNPRIPFLADGIRADHHPTLGPFVVADRDFKAGDVILREKPMVTCVDEQAVFGRCNHCLSTNMRHLIPCPDCTWAMFCDDKCLREGHRVHRFECGIYLAACKLNDFWMGPRLFFHGLFLFNDDVTKMMEFCKEVQGTERSFFDLDYSSYDPVAEFRAFLTAIPRRPGKPIYDNILLFNSALFFDLCMKVPLVQELFTTDEQKDFMQQCFVDYQIRRRGFTILQTEHGHLYPIASYFGHSCDPNAIVIESGNELRMIVQRPILRGDQIHFSYGPTYDQTPSQHDYYFHGLGFACLCDFCDPVKRKEWMAKHKKPSAIDQADWDMVKKVGGDAELTVADKMNAIQQFIQRYGSSHPQEDYAKMVRIYSEGLTAAHNFEMYYATQRKICDST